jgi:uncharacterized membrane protein
MFVAALGSQTEAAAALKNFKAMNRDAPIDLIDGAVIVHGTDTKVHCEETADPSGKKCATRGAIAGGLGGLSFPPSIIVGAAVGAVGGAVLGKTRDMLSRIRILRRASKVWSANVGVHSAEDRVLDRLETGLQGYIARPRTQCPCGRHDCG